MRGVASLLTLLLSAALVGCGPTTAAPKRDRDALVRHLEQISWTEPGPQGLRLDTVSSEPAKVTLHRAQRVSLYGVFESKFRYGSRGRVSYFVLDSRWQAFGEFIQSRRTLTQMIEEGFLEWSGVLLDQPRRASALDSDGRWSATSPQATSWSTLPSCRGSRTKRSLWLP
jgi:hypothetical protein